MFDASRSTLPKAGTPPSPSSRRPQPATPQGPEMPCSIGQLAWRAKIEVLRPMKAPICLVLSGNKPGELEFAIPQLVRWRACPATPLTAAAPPHTTLGQLRLSSQGSLTTDTRTVGSSFSPPITDVRRLTLNTAEGGDASVSNIVPTTTCAAQRPRDVLSYPMLAASRSTLPKAGTPPSPLSNGPSARILRLVDSTT